VTRTRRMSRRKIVDLTSKKKKDTMIPARGPISKADGQVSLGQTVITADPLRQIFPFLWMASGRVPLQNATTPGFPADKATRSATEVYFKLISEKIEIQTDTASPWLWRRIVFAFQGSDEFLDIGDDSVPTPTLLGTNGYARFTADLYSDSDSAAVNNTLVNVLFAGKVGVDFVNAMTAPINTQRVKLLYDRTIPIRSGNEQGTIKQFKRNHWIKKRIVYADQEDGGGLDGSEHSAPTRNSFGDVFIYDLFEAAQLADGDKLFFEPQATVYWHER